ncbi:unnamed protein product [Mortierella alpina]
MIRLRKCLGVMELKTGVTIITVFAILNKVSGFFGIFANGGLTKVIMYLYSVFATFAFAWGLYGVLVDNTLIVGRYALAYVVDLLINAIQTIALARSSTTPISDEVRQGFEFEGGISILILLSLWCLHLYFALVVWSYAHSLVHRYDLPFNTVGGAMSSGSDATPMMFLPRMGQDRGKHTVLRNEDNDEFI